MLQGLISSEKNNTVDACDTALTAGGAALRLPGMKRARAPFWLFVGSILHPVTVALLAVSAGSSCGARGTGVAELRNGEVVEVTSVVKGDEVTVTTGVGEARVRLLGIQAFSAVITDPQVQALSAGSIAAFKDLVGRARVKVVFDTPVQDASGRYLAYLEKEGVDLNRRLVDEGWAVVYTEYPFAREGDYFAAEARARAERRNIWVLAPAADAVLGLRKQWAAARRAGARPMIADPLLP